MDHRNADEDLGMVLAPWASSSSMVRGLAGVNMQRKQISQLRLLWPGVRVEATATGIWVDKTTQSLLLDDPSKGRFRRLS